MRLNLSLLTFLFPLLSLAQHTLTVEFTGISERRGDVMLALRDAEGNDLEQIIVDIPSSGTIAHTFRTVSTGTYTVACYHDKNSNRKLDKNLMGLPLEKYGFSNDARGTFGPPDLEDQQFRVSGNRTIRIRLQ